MPGCRIDLPLNEDMYARETELIQVPIKFYSPPCTGGAGRTAGTARPSRVTVPGHSAGASRGSCQSLHARKRGQVVRRSELGNNLFPSPLAETAARLSLCDFTVGPI